MKDIKQLSDKLEGGRIAKREDQKKTIIDKITRRDSDKLLHFLLIKIVVYVYINDMVI